MQMNTVIATVAFHLDYFWNQIKKQGGHTHEEFFLILIKQIKEHFLFWDVPSAGIDAWPRLKLSLSLSCHCPIIALLVGTA